MINCLPVKSTHPPNRLNIKKKNSLAINAHTHSPNETYAAIRFSVRFPHQIIDITITQLFLSRSANVSFSHLIRAYGDCADMH